MFAYYIYIPTSRNLIKENVIFIKHNFTQSICIHIFCLFISFICHVSVVFSCFVSMSLILKDEPVGICFLNMTILWLQLNVFCCLSRLCSVWAPCYWSLRHLGIVTTSQRKIVLRVTIIRANIILYFFFFYGYLTLPNISPEK